VLDNGSGLSRSERISPAQLEGVVRAGLASRWAPEFLASLPIAGVDGTLRSRLTASPAAGTGAAEDRHAAQRGGAGRHHDRRRRAAAGGGGGDQPRRPAATPDAAAARRADRLGGAHALCADAPEAAATAAGPVGELVPIK
jgi:hypothetical protein